MLQLTRSRQDYLKALFALSPAGEAVPTSRLATQLGVKAPSVTNMKYWLTCAQLIAAGAPTNADIGIVTVLHVLSVFMP